ncbi:hypothetical protein HOY34_17475 [Xinfangfangia sp. D13-10-4-6]|uniref:hypothetical protein n=1 Tax=Pseudogemmobacter hezensis TaxID=2737662 RepID=UPI00155583FE|nr:hypothetical protein [Pseudogemmobacter hezensis]NPD16986.1 hypothetical protein [Pseudogemmobacter hezensis]
MAILSRSAFAFALLLGSTSLVAADAVFDAPAAFTGQVSASGPNRSAIYPGGEVVVTGAGFAPGQIVTLSRGGDLISPEGLSADAEGAFTFPLVLPPDAVIGQHPIVVEAEGPDSAAVIDLKISPRIPLSGAEHYDMASVKTAPGVYQVAFSAKNGTVFTASATGRGDKGTSSLVKFDAKTLEKLAEAAPYFDAENGLYGAFGIAVDDENGTVWVTNTRTSSVAIYSQDDLSLVKQFPAGSVEKPRDVVIDTARGRAWISTHRTRIEEFDLKSLEKLEGFEVKSAERGGQFGTMSLALDADKGQLYTVSLRTPEVARIDLASRETTIIPLPGAKTASGVAIDPETGRIFIASQGSDDVIALDAEGKVLFDTPVGAQTLNLVFDKASGQLFAANRASDTITVVDASSGEITANLDGGSFPNHLAISPEGVVFAVNKARGEDDAKGDHLTRITAKH